jgi:allantoin racemase
VRILVINPNSSKSMTESIATHLEIIRRRDTMIDVVTTEAAPHAIQSARDAALSAPEILKRVERANGEDVDAIVIACFSDPGLEAAREVSNCLVLGIEESSLHVASVLGHRFSILTPIASRIPSKEQDVRRFKADPACASVRALGLSVSETESDPERTKARVLEVARDTVREDGAEVLILGCAGMTGYAQDIERELGIVVLDPTSVTVKLAEALVDLGIRHCKQGLYAAPQAQ